MWAMRYLELIGTDAAEVAISARWTVQPIDVVGYVRGRHLPTVIDTFLDPFLPQITEEGITHATFGRDTVN